MSNGDAPVGGELGSSLPGLLHHFLDFRLQLEPLFVHDIQFVVLARGLVSDQQRHADERINYLGDSF